MKRLLLRPAAEQDIDDIWSYIARDDPVAADRFVDRLHREMETLLRTPFMGEACAHLLPDLRRIRVGRYLIFYAIVGDDVVVDRVLHGARDIEAQFR